LALAQVFKLQKMVIEMQGDMIMKVCVCTLPLSEVCFQQPQYLLGRSALP